MILKGGGVNMSLKTYIHPCFEIMLNTSKMENFSMKKFYALILDNFQTFFCEKQTRFKYFVH